jgi:hypothetical protein
MRRNIRVRQQKDHELALNGLAIALLQAAREAAERKGQAATAKAAEARDDD